MTLGNLLPRQAKQTLYAELKPVQFDNAHSTPLILTSVVRIELAHRLFEATPREQVL